MQPAEEFVDDSTNADAHVIRSAFKYALLYIQCRRKSDVAPSKYYLFYLIIINIYLFNYYLLELLASNYK